MRVTEVIEERRGVLIGSLVKDKCFFNFALYLDCDFDLIFNSFGDNR